MKILKSILKTIWTFTASLIFGLALAFLFSKVYNYVFHGGAQHLSEPEVEIHDIMSEGHSVLPGDVITYSPYLTNTGESDVYVVLTITCKCYEADTVQMQEEWDNTDDPIPAYVITTNDGWELKDKTVSNGEMTRYYAYTTRLAPGEDTPPLCNEIQYNLFDIPHTFANFENSDTAFSIAYDAGLSDMTSLDGVVMQSRFRE